MVCAPVFWMSEKYFTFFPITHRRNRHSSHSDDCGRVKETSFAFFFDCQKEWKVDFYAARRREKNLIKKIGFLCAFVVFLACNSLTTPHGVFPPHYKFNAMRRRWNRLIFSDGLTRVGRRKEKTHTARKQKGIVKMSNLICFWGIKADTVNICVYLLQSQQTDETNFKQSATTVRALCAAFKIIDEAHQEN